MRAGSPSDREKLAYELVRWGQIDFKGKGVMETWWLEGVTDGNGAGQ
ncbi:MAG: hypothetical protein WBJ03_09625 [Moraxellaceae bacterium]